MLAPSFSGDDFGTDLQKDPLDGVRKTITQRLGLYGRVFAVAVPRSPSHPSNWLKEQKTHTNSYGKCMKKKEKKKKWH